MAKESSVDWDSIEPDWRAGIKTKKMLAEEYGVSRAAIDKHFAKLGIERDLNAKIQAEVETMVARKTVTRKVTQHRLNVTEREIVTSNAEEVSDKIIFQKDAAGEAVALSVLHLREVAAASSMAPLLEELGELMRNEDDKGQDKLNDAYRKIIALPSRVDAGKKAIESLKISVELQRKVLRVNDDSPLEDAANSIAAAAANISSAEAYKRMISRK